MVFKGAVFRPGIPKGESRQFSTLLSYILGPIAIIVESVKEDL
jgi:hypothetical protein